MREISLQELQQLELAMLLEFDAVCKKHKLRYYLDGGTLLGAVCYDGFIPWDDDIDLKMPRPDYERLLALQADFPPHLLLEAPSKEHCDYTFLKLVDQRTVLEEQNNYKNKTTGVYIDILPMDGHPKDVAARKKHLMAMQRYTSLFHEAQTGFRQLRHRSNWKTRFKGYLYHVLYSPWRLVRIMEKRAKRYPYDQASQVGLLVEGDPIRECFEKSWLEPPVMMEFEGHLFPAPNKAEKHLTIFYRKPISRELYYQNLPKIPSAHNHLVYWKEDPCQA